MEFLQIHIHRKQNLQHEMEYFIPQFLVEIQEYVISAWFVKTNNCQCMEVLYNFFRLAGTGVANGRYRRSWKL